MAKAQKKSGRSTRGAKKAEVKVVDEAGVEIVEGGLTFDDAIVFSTTFLLAVAVAFIVMAYQKYAGVAA